MVLPGACQDFYPSVKTSLANFLPGVFHSDTCAGLIKTYINATMNIGFKIFVFTALLFAGLSIILA